MNFEAPTYSQSSSPAGVMMLLLARLLQALARPFQTREDRRAYREHAYRVRAAIQHVESQNEIQANNPQIIARWSGDAARHWLDRLRGLWIDSPVRAPRKNETNTDIQPHDANIIMDFCAARQAPSINGPPVNPSFAKPYAVRSDSRGHVCWKKHLNCSRPLA